MESVEILAEHRDKNGELHVRTFRLDEDTEHPVLELLERDDTAVVTMHHTDCTYTKFWLKEQFIMITLIIVKRYDDPAQYGLHTDAPIRDLREGVFWAVGLFDWQGIANKIDEPKFRSATVEIPATKFDLDKLISCAPIEWHAAMRQGEMLDRFQVFTTPGFDSLHTHTLSLVKE